MDPKLAETLYTQHSPGLYRYALSILKRPALAEDVLQDTFLRPLTRCPLTLTPEKAPAWLYRVARNLCYDILRSQTQAIEEPTPIVPGGYAYLDLISPLTPAEQELVTLRIVGRLTHKETAKVLGITPASAQKRYDRAIQKLRETEELL